MANIGTFKKSGDNSYIGEIVTMSLQKKNVTIVAEDASENENAPSHRDPSFTAPIFASLFADEDGKTFNLIWSRARTSNGN
jgi:uncharacterized protein (DUF736 family)